MLHIISQVRTLKIDKKITLFLSDFHKLGVYYKNPNSPNAVSPEEATTDATVAGMAYFGPPDEAMTFIYFGIDKTYPGGYKGYSKDVNGLLDKGYKKLYNFIINH